jgi:hypothetical protein
MKIDVCSDSFPLAWAFVVPQGRLWPLLRCRVAMSLALGILFCTAKKYQKNSQRKKLTFAFSLLYCNGGHLAFGAFIKIIFSSNSFPLAWAFVVVQDNELKMYSV